MEGGRGRGEWGLGGGGGEEGSERERGGIIDFRFLRRCVCLFSFSADQKSCQSSVGSVYFRQRDEGD